LSACILMSLVVDDVLRHGCAAHAPHLPVDSPDEFGGGL
jgi:hypothetical protein